jgi:predicted ester cyclase
MMGAMGDLENRNKSVVRQFGEALNNHALSLLDEIVAPDFVRYCQATPWIEIHSRDDFKRFLEGDWASVPDGQTNLRLLVAEGDFVAVYCTLTGTQTGPWGPFSPSGKRFELDFAGVFRLAGGKIVELWVTWDNLAALTQLGHMPPMPHQSVA